MTGRKIILTGIGVFILLLIICFGTLAIDRKPEPCYQWTITTLKEYVDQRFTQLQLAVDKAEQATEKRFESVNEFRMTLSDQQRTFVPRAEYESGHAAIHTEVAELKARLDEIENLKAGGSNTIAWLAAGIGLIIAIIALSRNFISSIFQKNKEGIK